MGFWMERPPSKSHGGATGFKAPPGVTVNQVPPDKSLDRAIRDKVLNELGPVPGLQVTVVAVTTGKFKECQKSAVLGTLELA